MSTRQRVHPGDAGPRPREALLQAVVESAHSGLVLADARGVVVLANRAAARLFGYSGEELIGRTVQSLVPRRFTEDHSGLRAAFAAQLRGRAANADRALFGLKKDGTEFPIGLRLGGVGAAGRRYVLASVDDLGDRLLADERVRLAIESSPCGLLMTDPDGRIVLVNREIESLFGYAREELLSQPLELLVPARMRHSHEELRRWFSGEPQVRPMGSGRELVGRRKDGTEIPVEIGLNPVKTGGGLLVLASVVDIGRRKKIEEELRRSNEELERFAYVASHDLQEPLRTVASYVQLLSRRYRDRLGGDAAEFIDFAVGGVHRMQRLIADLLAFSRVGTRGGTPVVTSAGAVLSQAIDSLRAAIDESGTTITVDPLPSVAVDPLQLEQLFTNLVGNAIKFRSASAPAVHVSAVREDGFCVFSVRDNGVGIDPQYFDRIFVIFQRLNRREDYEGNGVGLAICKKIVERHGGRIWVESAVGRGATFSFSLPAGEQ